MDENSESKLSGFSTKLALNYEIFIFDFSKVFWPSRPKIANVKIDLSFEKGKKISVNKIRYTFLNEYFFANIFAWMNYC